MALEDESNEVFDSNLSYSSDDDDDDDDDDDMDDLYHKLYDSLVRAKKELKLKILENEYLLGKVRCLENENHDLNLMVKQLLTQNKACDECTVLNDKNLKLSKSLQSFTNKKK